MELLSVILGIVVYFFIGLVFLRLFSFSESIFERIGISFGLGAGIISFQMFLYILLGIKLSAVAIIAPWFIVSGIYVLFFMKEFKMFIPFRLTMFSKSLLVLILLNILYVFFQSNIRPLYSWDAVANWSFLSKAVFVDKTISGEFYQFANLDIPYLVSFQEAFIYFLHGSVIENTVLLIFPFYYVSLLTLFYSSVRNFLSTTYALLFTFLLASLPNLLRQAGTYDIGYVDISLSYYMFASVILLQKYMNGQKYALPLLGLFLGFSSLVKGEGQSFFIIVSLILTIVMYKQKKLGEIVWIFPGLFMYLSWKYFSVVQQIPSHYLYSGMLQPMRIFVIFELLIREFVYVIRWNFLWVALVISFCISVIQKKLNVITLILVLQLFFYMGIYLYTPLDVYGHIQGSLDRFLLQISPLALYIVASFYNSFVLHHEKN